MAISELEDCLSTSEYPPRRRAGPLGLEMAGLAELGRAASSAELCVIGWQGRGVPSLACAPRKDPRFDALGGAALALLANQSRAGEGGSPRIFHVEAAELAARFDVAGASLGLELTAEAAGEESAAAIALVLTAPSRPAAEVEATLALLVRAALNFVMAKENLSSREFWRDRARTSGAELARAERHAAQAEAGRRRVDDALAEAAKLKPRDLPAGIGCVVAGVGPFDAWILALGEGHTLRVDASSQPFDAFAPGVSLDPRSALFDSFSRRTTILRLGLAASGAPYDEDRLFGRCGFSSYLFISASRSTPE